MLLVGFEPTISAGERPQTYALDRAATGTGILQLLEEINFHSILMCVIKFYKLFSVAPEFIWVNTVKFV